MKIKVVIEDTSDSHDKYPTVTPWCVKDECLLVGCECNDKLKCVSKSGCIYEFSHPIDCRFTRGDG